MAVPHRRELVTQGSQNQQDASELIKSLIHPKYTMKIRNWTGRKDALQKWQHCTGGERNEK